MNNKRKRKRKKKNKAAKTIQWGGERLSTKALGKLTIHRQKHGVGALPYTKINSKYIKDLIVRTKNYCILRRE
jgi:hypothetical protein